MSERSLHFAGDADAWRAAMHRIENAIICGIFAAIGVSLCLLGGLVVGCGTRDVLEMAGFDGGESLAAGILVGSVAAVCGMISAFGRTR